MKQNSEHTYQHLNWLYFNTLYFDICCFIIIEYTNLSLSLYSAMRTLSNAFVSLSHCSVTLLLLCSLFLAILSRLFRLFFSSFCFVCFLLFFGWRLFSASDYYMAQRTQHANSVDEFCRGLFFFCLFLLCFFLAVAIALLLAFSFCSFARWYLCRSWDAPNIMPIKFL